MKAYFKKTIIVMLLVLPTIAVADYTIVPLRAVLTPTKKIAPLTFTNNLSEEKNFQISVLCQHGSHEEYKLSKDLIVTPSIFKVGGGKSQLIRVAMRNELLSEGSQYRLSIKELPLRVPLNARNVVAIYPDFRVPVYIGEKAVNDADIAEAEYEDKQLNKSHTSDMSQHGSSQINPK